MYEVEEKPEAVESLQTLQEKSVKRVERPCRGCGNLTGVSILYDVNAYGRVPLKYHYTCRNGLVLLATTKKEGECPNKSFKPRENGEVELTPESLSKNGF